MPRHRTCTTWENGPCSDKGRDESKRFVIGLGYVAVVPCVTTPTSGEGVACGAAMQVLEMIEGCFFAISLASLIHF